MKSRQLDLDFAHPPSSGPETSAQAAEAIEPRAETLRRAVLDFVRARGAWGATDEEIQVGLGLAGDTERPRRWELSKVGLVVESDLRRRTAAGREAIVWVVGEMTRKEIGDGA